MSEKNPWKSVKITQIQSPQTISHMSKDAKLIYVLSGEAIINSHDISMAFGVGEFFVVPNFTGVSITFTVEKFRVYLLNFTYFGSDSIDKLEVFKGDSKSRGEPVNSTLSISLQQILRLYYLSYKTVSYWEVGALYFQIINKLEKKYLVKIPREKGLLSKEKLASYISQNITEEISIDDLAKHFFVSKQTMSRFFRNEFDKPFGKYLQEQRFLRLEKLLAETETPINTLVYEVGFRNLNSFNRLFKKQYGTTPHEWRNNFGKSVVPEEHTTVAQDFLDFQSQIRDKTDLLHVSAKEIVGEYKKGRIWNLDYADILGDIEHVIVTCQKFNGGYFRIPIDFSKISQIQYLQILSKCLQTKVILNFKVEDVQKNNEILYFLKQYVIRFGFNALDKVFLELGIDIANKDEFAEYCRLHDNIKTDYYPVKCGLGGLNFEYEGLLESDILPFVQLRDRFDFISYNVIPKIKANSHYSLRENIVSFSHLSRLFKKIEDQVHIIKDKLGSNIPLFLSFFNLTANQSDAINDHLYHADYYLAFLAKAEPLFDVIGYGPLFENRQDVFQDEFSGQGGLVTISGIPKATFYAEVFLKNLGNNLLGKNEKALVTSFGQRSFSIVAYNQAPLRANYSSNKDINLYQNQNYIFDLESRVIQLQIDDVPNGIYKATFSILDQENGHGPEVLRRFTGLKRLDSYMGDYIKTQYQPRIYQKEFVISDNILSEKLYLKPFEIAKIDYELVDLNSEKTRK